MVNEYLNKDVEENELDAKKPYLYMQEPSNRYSVSPGDEKTYIGTTNSERDKFLRYMRKQKEQQEINMEEKEKKEGRISKSNDKLDVDS